jgi:hypothetical protein
MEYVVVQVASYSRHLASASKVHWQAGAAAPALEQEPKLPLPSPLKALLIEPHVAEAPCVVRSRSSLSPLRSKRS